MSLCKFTSYYRYYLHTAQQKEFVGLLVRFALELSYGNCFRSRLCPLTSFTRYLLQFRSLQSSMPSTFQFDLMPFNAIPQAEDEHQNIFYVQAYLHIHTYTHTTTQSYGLMVYAKNKWHRSDRTRSLLASPFSQLTIKLVVLNWILKIADIHLVYVSNQRCNTLEIS